MNNPAEFRSFTIKFAGRAKSIITDLGIAAIDPANPAPTEPPTRFLRTKALWDTGATNTFIKKEIAEFLGLVAVGASDVNHAGGQTKLANRYLANLLLPESIYIGGVPVIECMPEGVDFGVIIGMDIICNGDLAITNVNNLTWVSFRIPSGGRIDYAKEV